MSAKITLTRDPQSAPHTSRCGCKDCLRVPKSPVVSRDNCMVADKKYKLTKFEFSKMEQEWFVHVMTTISGSRKSPIHQCMSLELFNRLCEKTTYKEQENE